MGSPAGSDLAETMEGKDRKVTVEAQVCPVREWSRSISCQKEREETTDIQEQMDSPGHEVIKGCLGREAAPAGLVCRGSKGRRRALRGTQAIQGLADNQDSQDRRALPASSASQGCQGKGVPMAFQDLLDFQAVRGHPDKKVSVAMAPDLLEPLETKDSPASLELLARQVTTASRATLVSLETPESTDRKVSLETQAAQDCQVALVSPVLVVILVSPDQLDCLDLLDSPALTAPPDKKVSLAPLVWMV